MNTKLDAKISQLERENFTLAAGLCLHGLKGDDHGNQYCPRIKQLEAERAKLVEALRAELATTTRQATIDLLRELGEFE